MEITIEITFEKKVGEKKPSVVERLIWAGISEEIKLFNRFRFCDILLLCPFEKMTILIVLTLYWGEIFKIK